MLRIILFLATNFAVILLVHIIMSLLGLDPSGAAGMNYGSLWSSRSLFGFIGSFVSLAMSKWIAKRSVGAQVLDGTEGTQAQWLVQTTHALADRAGIGRPEVAIFRGEPNAFATGANRNNALVAVSDGLMHSMSKDEVEAVLAHEVGHIANGDMITMSLLQGVLNTFVIFLSRVVAQIIGNFLRSDGKLGSMSGMAYLRPYSLWRLSLGSGLHYRDVVFRLREYRADASAASFSVHPSPWCERFRRLREGVRAKGCHLPCLHLVSETSLPLRRSSPAISISSRIERLKQLNHRPPTESVARPGNGRDLLAVSWSRLYAWSK